MLYGRISVPVMDVKIENYGTLTPYGSSHRATLLVHYSMIPADVQAPIATAPAGAAACHREVTKSRPHKFDQPAMEGGPVSPSACWKGFSDSDC